MYSSIVGFTKHCSMLKIVGQFTKEILRSTITSTIPFKAIEPIYIDDKSEGIDFALLHSTTGEAINKANIFKEINVLLPYLIEFKGNPSKIKFRLNTKKEGKLLDKKYIPDTSKAVFNIQTSEMETRYPGDPGDEWRDFWRRIQNTFTRLNPGVNLSVLDNYSLLTTFNFKRVDSTTPSFATIVDAFERVNFVPVTFNDPPTGGFLRLFEIMTLFVTAYEARANLQLNNLILKGDKSILDAHDEITRLANTDYTSAANRIDKMLAEMHRPSAMWSTLPIIMGRITLKAHATSAIARATTTVSLVPASPLYGVPTDVLTGNTLDMPDRDYISERASQPGVIVALVHAFAELVAATMNATQQRFPSAYNTREQNVMANNDLPMRTRAMGRFRAIRTGRPREWAVYMV
jgi:hypothetical protein